MKSFTCRHDNRSRNDWAHTLGSSGSLGARLAVEKLIMSKGKVKKDAQKSLKEKRQEKRERRKLQAK